jgi:hypothetical protein
MARIRKPKVGILVECGRQGLEFVVCRRLCMLLRENTGIDFVEEIVPMDDKRNLIQTCGAATASLFASGFDRVVILWDERPAWPTACERLCWHDTEQDFRATFEQDDGATQVRRAACKVRARTPAQLGTLLNARS